MPRTSGRYRRVVKGEGVFEGPVEICSQERRSVVTGEERGASTVLGVDELLEVHEEMAGRVGVMGVDWKGDALVTKSCAILVPFGGNRVYKSVGLETVNPNLSSLKSGEGTAKASPSTCQAN